MLMFMTGIGNTEKDYDRAIEALRDIAETHVQADTRERGSGTVFDIPESGRIAKIPAEKIMVPLEEAEGMVCASYVTPYPPGIPLVCPGEVFTGGMIRYIGRLTDAGEKITGISADGMVAAGKEDEDEGQ